MAKCPSCNKFSSLDTDVEVENLEYEGGMIGGTIRVVRRSQCCGDEIKEMSFDVEHDTGIGDEHDGDGHDVTVEHDDGEATESGGGRYAKNLVGFSVNVSVFCSCRKPKNGADPESIWEGSIEDNAPASHYEELV